MARQAWNAEELDEMVTAYVAVALESSTDDEGDTLDVRYVPDDLTDEAREALRVQVMDFYRANRRVLAPYVTPLQAGGLFWLNRNGHGTGFWDQGYVGANTTVAYRTRYGITLGEARRWVRRNAALDRLAADSRVHGEVNLYIGDDDRLHVA